MGVIAESIVAYAQPLLDETDGSIENMNRALFLAQLCWNLALLSEKEREQSLAEMRPSFAMDDAEFKDFQQSVVQPMIRRHYEMFPNMPRLGSASASRATTVAGAQRYPGLRLAVRAAGERRDST
jgi:hypothetical protein